MSVAAVRADLLQATNMLQGFATKLTLGAVLVLNTIAYGASLLFRELPTAGERVHADLLKNAQAGTAPNAIDVRERNLNALLVGEHDACDTNGHGSRNDKLRIMDARPVANPKFLIQNS